MEVLAWYFAEENKRLRYGDNRKIVVGESHHFNGEPKLCERGLHGSVRILDALQYAPGPMVYRVELSGTMDIGDDKIAATNRKYLSGGIDISDVLREFVRKQALSVAHLWDMPEVTKKYLETGNESIRFAARSAAIAAAWDASSSARAVRAAVMAAVRATALDAKNAAAWAAAGAAANTMLEDMVTKAIGGGNV
jgi:hypothetical protein